jgi:hypothetical protein
LLAALVLCGGAAAILAQPPALPSQPVPVGPSPNALPPIVLPRELPPGNPSFVPATPVFVDEPFRPVVQPERPVYAAPGLYGLLEFSLLFPELRGWLQGPVNLAGFQDTVVLGSANVDGTGSPRVEVGYRLGDGLGAVALSYRSVVTEGGGNIANFDVLGAGFLSSRLNLNVVDLDYVSPAYNIAPFWDFAWRAGVRGTAAYFDNRAIGGFAQLHASNNFLGAGPHGTLEVARALNLVPGLAVTSKLDGAVLIGQTTQSFEETLTFPSGDIFGGASRLHGTQSVPVLTFNVGLAYSPPGFGNWARFGFGYQFEYWWDLGRRGDSRGDLSINGIYFRGEFNF